MHCTEPPPGDPRVLPPLNLTLAQAVQRYREHLGIPAVPLPALPTPHGIQILLAITHPVREVQKVGS